MDNNLVENAIRPLAIGRNNHPYGSVVAAVRVVIVYSLIGSCKAIDIEPRKWQEDVLIRILYNITDTTVLKDLLPDRWNKTSL